jgi:uncharacterized damage-inducible protein DinB
MSKYEFLVETYATERLKTLGVWSQIPDERMPFRSEPRARTPLEHMVHQCTSEDAWMSGMLGIMTTLPVLPASENRVAFLHHYAAASQERLTALRARPDDWFEAEARFFDAIRSRAWILVRRFTHSAHHRGQLTADVRSWGQSLFSTYGPTADTGGLPKHGATVIYRYPSVEELLSGETQGSVAPVLPGPGAAPPTERAADPWR